MLSIFPYKHGNRYYFTLRQIAGALDVATPTFYQAMEGLEVERYSIANRDCKKNFKTKMIPSEIGLKIYEDFSCIKIKPGNPEEVIKTLKKILKKYCETQQKASSSPTVEKTKNLSKRIFSILG